jgi:ABC-2 type transport system permease protein
MVYDRELGSMRVLLTSPMPRWFLLLCKLMSGTLLSLAQVYVFLLIAFAYGIQLPPLGYLCAMPALLLSGMMLGGLGLLMSSMIKQLENFAGVMNFIIFPMFFTSSALYPLWKVEEASPILRDICAVNPFTYAVELIRFALYVQFESYSALVVLGCMVVFIVAAVVAYDPSKGIITRVRAGAPA